MKDYFRDMFTDNGAIGIPASWPSMFHSISTTNQELFNKHVTLEEVKASLFSIGKHKAPGPDELPARFFQRFWDLRQKDIFTLIHQCFSYAWIPSDLNETFIVLIPKTQNLTSMTQIRPISLCITLYKILSKILVAIISLPFCHVYGETFLAY